MTSAAIFRILKLAEIHFYDSLRYCPHRRDPEYGIQLVSRIDIEIVTRICEKIMKVLCRNERNN